MSPRPPWLGSCLATGVARFWQGWAGLYLVLAQKHNVSRQAAFVNSHDTSYREADQRDAAHLHARGDARLHPVLRHRRPGQHHNEMYQFSLESFIRNRGLRGESSRLLLVKSTAVAYISSFEDFPSIFSPHLSPAVCWCPNARARWLFDFQTRMRAD